MKQSTIWIFCCSEVTSCELLLKIEIMYVPWWIVLKSSEAKWTASHAIWKLVFTKQIRKRCRIVHREMVHVLVWKWEATRGSKHACPSADRVGLYCCSGKSISTEKGIRGFHNCPQEKSNASLRWRILEVCMYSRRLYHKIFKRKRVYIMTDAFWYFQQTRNWACYSFLLCKQKVA